MDIQSVEPSTRSTIPSDIADQAVDPAEVGDDNEFIVSSASREKILVRQAQERKDLRTRVDRIRSSIPKKDRAGRARAAEDAADDEKRLLEAQAVERLESGISEEDVCQMVPPAPNSESVPNADETQKPKESKAARRRRKKAEQEAESERRVKAEKAGMGPSPKFLEIAAIETQLKPQNLRIQVVAADGHCLYSAVAHQMTVNGLESQVPASVKELRNVTADFLMSHRDDYMPFLETVNGDKELFTKYCDELRNEAVWGGQVELKVIAEILATEIEVYAANMPVVRMGQRSESAPVLRISFHRHYLGLGEHYNSIVPQTQN